MIFDKQKNTLRQQPFYGHSTAIRLQVYGNSTAGLGLSLSPLLPSLQSRDSNINGIDEDAGGMTWHGTPRHIYCLSVDKLPYISAQGIIEIAASSLNQSLSSISRNGDCRTISTRKFVHEITDTEVNHISWSGNCGGCRKISRQKFV